eukprot:scaffold201666_cov24-Prasinocladus_malaysianus.AAC.1
MHTVHYHQHSNYHRYECYSASIISGGVPSGQPSVACGPDDLHGRASPGPEQRGLAGLAGGRLGGRSRGELSIAPLNCAIPTWLFCCKLFYYGMSSIRI